MFEQTKKLCDSFLKMGIPGFDLMVMKDGEVALRYVKGYADPDTKTPMNGKEKYHIYSCSKLLTVIADLRGETVNVPLPEENYDPSITY